MASPPRPESVLQVGNHLVESEGPDLLILRVRGDVSPQEARQLIVLDREQAQRNGYSLILIDGRGCGRFDPGTRKAMFDEMQRHPGYIGSTAMYGLTGPLMLIMKLVLRAMALLGTTFDDEMQMFSTEKEGRAFIELRRPQRQQQARKNRS